MKLGDEIKRVTDALGIKQCDACKERQRIMNEWTAGGPGNTSDAWGVDAWLAVGVGTAAAMIAAVWVIDRIDRAKQEADREPSSALFQPRFGPHQTSRTYPPTSSRRDYVSPSDRIYPPRRPF